VFEARAMYIAVAMGKKIAKAIERDRTVPKSFKRKDYILANNEIDLATVLTFLDRLKQADPTPNHQYLQWIAKRYCENDFLLEDLRRVNNELQSFEKYKPRLRRDGKPTDINQYTTTAQVFAVINEYKTGNVAPSQKEAARREEDEMILTGRAYWWFQGDRIKVVVPTTMEAAIHFGKGTRWCTAATSSTNYFQNYARQGPLYIIMTPSGKYQFHFESHQFMTALDQPCSVVALIKEYPELKQAFDSVAQAIGFIPLMVTVTTEGFYNALKASMGARHEQYDDSQYVSVADLLESVDRSVQDEKIALLIIQHNPSLAVRLIRPDLQQLPSFERAMIERRPELLQAADPKVQTLELVTAVLRRAPTMLQYVRHDLMQKGLLLEVIQRTPQVLGQVPPEKQDLDIIKCALKATDNKMTKRNLVNMVHNKELKKYLQEALKQAS